jgi:hypothetical protein
VTSMTEVTGLEAVGVDDGAPMLPGDLVRGLVSRNEEAIDALLAHLDEVERSAAAAERSVREHPGLSLLPPGEAEQLIPAPPAPVVVVDDGRPRTTVVDRSRPTPSPGGRSRASRATAGTAALEMSKGWLTRLTTSHLWWRIGIVLVVVALLLVKFG